MALRALRSRGLVKQSTHECLDAAAAAAKSATGVPWSVYLGVDPTSANLHVGHLLGILSLRHCQSAGLRPVALVGGATGLVGDPTDRTAERPMLSEDIVRENAVGIERELRGLLDFDCGPSLSAKMVNNLDWFGKMSAIDLIRDVGRHFRINQMLARDSVKSRLNVKDGLSFTEFSYQLMQGHDFLHLHQHENCHVQIGGSDQWGNILAGCDLIRRVTGNDAYGVTTPLLTAAGKKLGKSAGNAIWLDAALTSDFEFYQYFVQLPDSDVEALLQMLTNVSADEIGALAHQRQVAPHERESQRRLAQEVLSIVRGRDAVASAERATDVMYGGGASSALSPEDVAALRASNQVPTVVLPAAQVRESTLLDCAVAASCAPTKGKIKQLVKAGGLYMNNERVSAKDLLARVDVDSLGGYMLFRTGKRNFKFLMFED